MGVLAVHVLAGASAKAAEPIVGPATVKDGDYLVIGTTHIRLYGIDAFERAQVCGDDAWPCGEAARDRLIALTEGREVRCAPRSTDWLGRSVAHCWVGGTDVAAVLVGEGLAVAFRRWSDDYADEEDAARAARAGAWSGRFTFPWDFRREAF